MELLDILKSLNPVHSREVVVLAFVITCHRRRTHSLIVIDDLVIKKRRKKKHTVNASREQFVLTS